ncbi:T. brucei spp.-specific protein [Trypanosoma brucei gambiense DAL972]|uniref:T. brucei spp.-specific protein n=1 Tax=Trypanosoma brucei gambiense (strain MHOM/CI/86/DAL972) TaxID=679716 RepID=D0A4L0_TRYB9|nr:T. brucei spp.-specific protein [Trypanosoma brucei gambiense DAL972]CBH16204.1 T. brucei spp.-specific protein [Trypanosoma brucei gambiense DAL972]|eukprot:XP_011778468.1 T. brucei spp.-specific protein [Trypanosoma brucei gambiense DAL972]
MVTPLVKRDGVLVPINSICWLAKNVFNVRVPLYRRVISCELSAVDVPRGTAPVLECAIDKAVSMIRDASHKYLRQDYYAEFPLLGYGDIIFSTNGQATEWASLQETLLFLGVGRIIRPICFRLEDLIDAEKRGALGEPVKVGAASAIPCAWAGDMSRHESSGLFRKVVAGRVVDVLRGDVYVVHWADKSADDNGGATSHESINADTSNGAANGEAECGASPLPELVVLDAVQCYSTSTDGGYAALRWAQKNLLFSQVEVCVHSLSPSEMEVANSTQLFSHDQLRCVRSTVRVTSFAREGDATEDVGCSLVRQGHGLVRQVVEAAVPRSSNFHDILRAASERCRTIFSRPVAPSGGARDWLLGGSPGPGGIEHTLESFLGQAWFEGPTLAALWKATMFAGNIFQSCESRPLRTHVERPMRTIWSITAPVRQNVTFEGTLKSLSLVQECIGVSSGSKASTHAGGLESVGMSGQDRSFFLRVEVDAIFTDETILQVVGREEERTLGTIVVAPPEEVVQGRKAQIRIKYDNSPSVALSGEAPALSVVQRKYWPGKYTPEKPTTAETSKMTRLVDRVFQTEVTVDLRLEDRENEMVFALDIFVEFQGQEKKLERRAVYLLSDTQEMVDNEEVSSSSDDGDEGDDSIPGGKNVTGTEGVVVSEGQSVVEEHAVDLEADSDRPEKDALSSEKIYHSKIDFYFKVDNSKRQTGDFTEELRKWSEGLAYRDVFCIPVGVATVNGDQGYVGDILVLMGNEMQGVDDRRGTRKSVLFELGAKWWVPAELSSEAPGHTWSMISSLVLKFFAKGLAEITAREQQQRSILVAEWWRRLTNVYNEMVAKKVTAQGMMDSRLPVGAGICGLRSAPRAGGTASSGPDGNHQEDIDEVFRVSAGKRDFWYLAEWEGVGSTGDTRVGSSEPRISPFPQLLDTFLPPRLPLFVVSIFPRQLFAAFHKHHRSLVNSKNSLTAKQASNLHVDSAFVRLPRPFLPNFFASNLERLPVSLRNTAGAFVESLMDGKVPRQRGTAEWSYCAHEGVLSSVLSLLFMLRPCEPTNGGAVNFDVYNLMGNDHKNLNSVNVPNIDCSAVLYRVYPRNCGQALDGQEPKDPVLFLGSFCSSTSEVFGSQESILPTDASAIKFVARALGVESLVSSSRGSLSFNGCLVSGDSSTDDGGVFSILEGGGKACYPMASLGVGNQPLTSGVPRLYLPLPWLAVLGPPLVTRDEFDASLQDRKPREETKRLYIAVSYVPMCFSPNKPYNPISYGRCKRSRIYQRVCERSRRGLGVKDYFSLLLRRRSPASSEKGASGRFADGTLRVYGTVNEPQFLYYQSRKQLRFHLGVQWPSILENFTNEKDATQAESEAEEKLLQEVAEAAKHVIDKVAERTSILQRFGGGANSRCTPPTRVYLRFRLNFQSNERSARKLRVMVYPVSEGNGRSMCGAEMGRGPEPPEGAAASQEELNPYRMFHMGDNVLSRSPYCVLVVSYCKESAKYQYEWDAGYESTS